MTTEERFWEKVIVGDPAECWPWTAATLRGGYGVFVPRRGHPIGAHRYAWLLERGEIPDGVCVLHRCDNPPCVNVAHLFLGTRADNAADMVAKRRHWSHRGPSVTVAERNGRARLTEPLIAAIRDRYRRGERQGALAADFGVARTTVGRIVRGETWA